jgi:DNA polymerase-3 subunit chi
MTRVDFYLLPDTDTDGKHLAACKLTHKAYRLGHRIYILTGGPEESEQLDRLLWTYSAGSFIPHGVHPQPPGSPLPVIIGHTEPPAGTDSVLISLAPQAPAFFERFERVAELVGASEEDRTRGRERFRYYRERGHPPQTHQL